MTTPALLPVTLATTSAGDAARLDAGGLSLLQYPATEAASGPAGVHLRLHTPDGPRSRALTGPACAGTRLEDGTVLTEHDGLEARVRLAPAADGEAWAWRIRLLHRGSAPVRLDLLHTLDVALTELEALRRNEQYVAQYLDLTPVELPADGSLPATLALAVRQNMPGPAAPWAVVGTDAPVAAWATDALQLLDLTTGEGLDPARELPSARLQHEHTLAALRTEVITLAPGERWEGSFWGFALADHPAATGPEDATLIRRVQARIGADDTASDDATSDDTTSADGTSAGDDTAGDTPADASSATGTPLATSLLATARPLPVREASEAEIAALAGGGLRLREEEDGRLLSAFSDRGHLVTAAKERQVLRPHGHIQQVHARAEADADVVASTVWMRGVFCSQLTLGHATVGALTSVRRSYLGLDPSGGVRLLLRGAEGWRRVSVPSLWRAQGGESEWLYLTEHGTLHVRSRALLGRGAEIEVAVSGREDASPLELLLVVGAESEDLAVTVTADGATVPLGDDAALFSDVRARGTGLLTAPLQVAEGAHVLLTRRGAAGSSAEAARPSADATSTAGYVPRLPVLRGAQGEAAAVGEMLAALAHDASIHFRSPRGLEQYSGGAWGTRDVCQGPVGLLLATDEPAVLRSTLLAVLAAQQEDGTWPQWFDYLPGFAGPGLRDSHGDVVYWPLRAVGEYLAVTCDRTLLAETAPWVGQDAMGAPTSVLDHLSRALDHIAASRTEDPRLPAYGHGDWNDSLQPARPELAEHLCSTWTTELEITALTTLADALPADVEGADALSARCRALAAGAEEALREVLLVDGELAGYAHLEDGGIDHLVHPGDTTTGVRHGSLQMIHAIADELLTPEEARHHVSLLREHLLGPTGIYLFDRPIGYHGGEMRVFQRAEAATFWGREVGLMYMHAHLRWIEALVHLGEAEQAWTELLKAIPIGLSERIEGARRRQADCYYSSSDAEYADRTAAAAHPEALFDAATGFEGGWRVYSSGPGLLLRLVVEDLLGVRRRGDLLEIDPVLPAALDGIEASLPVDGGMLTVRFTRGATGCGVAEVRADGTALPGEALEARYRRAGLAVPLAAVRGADVLEVRGA